MFFIFWITWCFLVVKWVSESKFVLFVRIISDLFMEKFFMYFKLNIIEFVEINDLLDI